MEMNDFYCCKGKCYVMIAYLAISLVLRLLTTLGNKPKKFDRSPIDDVICGSPDKARTDHFSRARAGHETSNTVQPENLADWPKTA